MVLSIISIQFRIWVEFLIGLFILEVTFSVRLGPLRWVLTAHCTGRQGINLLTEVSPVELAHWILLKANNRELSSDGCADFQCLIRKWSCVNHQFQLHTQIAYKPTYMTHDLCYLLLFIIGTDIKFNHTNLEIHSSGHSRGPFASASDYASAQWRLVLHILVTCASHVKKCWVMRAVVSWWAYLTGIEKAVQVFRSTGIFFNGFEKYLQILITD